MTTGVDVRIQPYRNAGHAAAASGDRFDPRQLARRLDVDRLDTECDGAFEFCRRLADAGKDDLRGGEPGLARHFDFPDRIGVGAGTEIVQHAHERQQRIRLERVVNRVRIAAERGVERAVPVPHLGSAVDVDRSAALSAMDASETPSQNRSWRESIEGGHDALCSRTISPAIIGGPALALPV